MNLKKIAVMLVTALTISLVGSTSVFAATPDEATAINLADYQSQLEEVAAKHGGQIEILNDVDPSTITLKFDSIEEFDQALDTLKIVEEPTQYISSQSELNTEVSPLSISEFEGTFIKDHTVYLSGAAICGVRNKVWATEYWDSFYQRNLFSTINNQTSYTYGAFTGGEWTQDRAVNDIIDSGRTLTSSIEGHAKLTASVGPFDVGYIFDQSFYDEWAPV